MRTRARQGVAESVQGRDVLSWALAAAQRLEAPRSVAWALLMQRAAVLAKPHPGPRWVEGPFTLGGTHAASHRVARHRRRSAPAGRLRQVHHHEPALVRRGRRATGPGAGLVAAGVEPLVRRRKRLREQPRTGP